MAGNAARKGPKRVWRGYKNLRVPEELFDEVKEFLELKKEEYLRGQQAGKENPVLSVLEQISMKLDVLIGQPAQVQLKSSKERIYELLKASPGKGFTTIEIAERLNMPKGTARQACREVFLSCDEVKVIKGRPNRYFYIPEGDSPEYWAEDSQLNGM